MESQVIKQMISDGSINAISLDTCAFGNPNETTLEHGLIARIRQFNGTSVSFVMSDVVLNEVASHMRRASTEALTFFTKALKACGGSWDVPKVNREKAINNLVGDETPSQMVQRRIDSFVQTNNCHIVAASEHADIKVLVEQYFSASPPFSEKESKKHEFPDALAVLSLDSWAKSNGKRILVISSDGDWKRYCEGSSYLVCVDDLASGLSLFHSNAEVASQALSQQLGANNDWIELIQQAVDSHICSMWFVPDADSQFYFEDEFCEATVEQIDFPEDFLLTALEYNADSLVAELNVSVEITCNCDFTFSMKDGFDKDYVPMGVASLNVKDTVYLRLLITFTGDIPTNVKIDQIEVDGSTRHHVDFGLIEPDWMNDPSNYEE